MATIYMIIICSLIYSQVIAELADQMDEQKILHRLFQHDPRPPLMGFDTKKHLDTLNSLYSSESDKIVVPTATRELVSELVELSQEKPCFDETSYAKYDKLSKSQANYKNIVEYIDYYRNIQLWKCKKLFAKTCLDLVTPIPSNFRYDLSKLKDEVKFASKDGLKTVRPFYSQEALALGVREYLMENSPEFKVKTGDKKKRVGQEEFVTLYKSTVEALCKSSVLNHDSASKRDEMQNDISVNLEMFSRFLVNQVANNEAFMEALDEFTREWIIKANICIDLMDKKNNLAENVRKLVIGCKDSGRVGKHFCFCS